MISEPPHPPVGRLLFIEPELLFSEITDCLSGKRISLRPEGIVGKVKASFGFSTDAVRFTLSLGNRQFSLLIDLTTL
jgi:hypothetical protein